MKHIIPYEHIEFISRMFVNALDNLAPKVTPYQFNNIIWEDCLQHYGEEHRIYHNLDHIYYMLNQVGRLWHSISGDVYIHDVAVLSTIYHDIIYDIGSRNNEESSAFHAAAILSRFEVMPETIHRIMYNIRTTEDHEPKFTKYGADIVCDADLAGLGVDQTIYFKNEAKVKAEYLQVHTLEEFKIGRIAFIKSFLLRDKIYLIDLDREAQARENLEKELEQISDSMV